MLSSSRCDENIRRITFDNDPYDGIFTPHARTTTFKKTTTYSTVYVCEGYPRAVSVLVDVYRGS